RPRNRGNSTLVLKLVRGASAATAPGLKRIPPPGGASATAYRQPPVAPGVGRVPRSAAICTSIYRNFSGSLRSSGFIRKYAQEHKKDVRDLSRGPVALDASDWPRSETLAQSL